MSTNIIFDNIIAEGPVPANRIKQAIIKTAGIVAKAAGIDSNIHIINIEYRADWSDLEDQNHVYTFVGASEGGQHQFNGSVNMAPSARKGWFCFDPLLNDPDREEFFQPMVDQFKKRVQ